jgi:hypothetical protein
MILSSRTEVEKMRTLFSVESEYGRHRSSLPAVGRTGSTRSVVSLNEGGLEQRTVRTAD